MQTTLALLEDSTCPRWDYVRHIYSVKITKYQPPTSLKFNLELYGYST